MPLYEYQCDNCNEIFEVMQKFSDQALETHKKCGGTVRRLISAPAFHFKGSGWYVTDYAKGSKSQGNGGSNKTEDSSSTKDQKKEATPKSTGSDTSNKSTSSSDSSSDKK